jgi:hypothetical protein
VKAALERQRGNGNSAIARSSVQPSQRGEIRSELEETGHFVLVAVDRARTGAGQGRVRSALIAMVLHAREIDPRSAAPAH